MRNQTLVATTGQAVLDLIAGYADTWRLLLEYDEDQLSAPPGVQPSHGVLHHDRAAEAVDSFKRELTARGQASSLFGNPRGDALEAILGAIEQTMFGQPLYRLPRGQRRRICSTSSSRTIPSPMATSASVPCCSCST